MSGLTTEELLEIVRLDPALTEWEHREATAEQDRFKPYRGRIDNFITEGIGGFIWSKQRLICESVTKNRFTAVPSCHGVGKSAIAARIGAAWIATEPPGDAFLVTSAPSFHQVRGILWRELNRVHRLGHLPGIMNQTEWHFGNELVAFGRKPDDQDMTAFQGIHARKVLVIFDEACGVPPPLWDAAETLVTNDESRMLAIGNPDDPASRFASICKPGSGWNVIPISAFDSPNLTGEYIPESLIPLLTSRTWVEERRRKWGETSPLYVAKVLGQFPDISDDVLIPMSLLTKAQNTDYVPTRDDVKVLGVDIARLGRDKTVLVFRHGTKIRIYKSYSKKDLMTTVGWILHAARELGVDWVVLDDTGVGGGVTDRLRELKKSGEITFNVLPLNFGAAAAVSKTKKTRNVRFYNIRSQIYWDFKEMLTYDEVDLDSPTSNGDSPMEDALSQLGSMKYGPNSRGEIQLESKEDYKDRTKLDSPDEADAIVLSAVNPLKFHKILTERKVSSLEGFSLFAR